MEGGAIDADGSCALTLTNVTVHGNSAAGSGGGVRLRGTGTTVVLANATITSNQADTNHGGNSFGGGVDVGSSSTMTMRNTVIADNTTGGVANDCHGVLTSQGHNLLREITGCTFTPAGTDLVAVAPDLGALQDNGGATNTRLPGAGSPLLNAGDPGVPGSGGTTCAAVDERDFGRPAGPTCDIGAVERDAITTTTTTGTTAPTTTTTVTTTTAASSTTTTSPSTSTTTTSMLPTALCPNPSPMQVTVLQVTKLDDPAGNERLVLQGVLALPAGTLPIVDPAASGLQLRVEDLGTDGSLLDLTTRTAPIPPGGKHTGCGPRDGWTNATYLNTSNAVDAPACPVDSAQGLRRVVLKDRRGKGHGVAFTAIVKGAALPMPTGPIRVTLVLGVTDDSPCGVFTSSLGRCGGRGARYRCR